MPVWGQNRSILWFEKVSNFPFIFSSSFALFIVLEGSGWLLRVTWWDCSLQVISLKDLQTMSRLATNCLRACVFVFILSLATYFIPFNESDLNTRLELLNSPLNTTLTSSQRFNLVNAAIISVSVPVCSHATVTNHCFDITLSFLLESSGLDLEYYSQWRGKIWWISENRDDNIVFISKYCCHGSILGKISNIGL